MITLFPEQAEILKKKPELLSSIAHKLMQAAANSHHPHNKLIPASDVEQLLNIVVQYDLTASNTDAAYSLLATSCLAALLKVNFNHLW
jgi:hypothetical protein